MDMVSLQLAGDHGMAGTGASALNGVPSDTAFSMALAEEGIAFAL